MDDPSVSEQIEALTDLQQHPGWLLFRRMVLEHIAGDFEEHITRALDVPDATVALDRMRQVAAVRKAGMGWLKLPTERVKTLQQQERPAVGLASASRRPDGV